MLKKSIIGLYLGTAVFLMSFNAATNDTAEIKFHQQPRAEITWEELANISKSLNVMPNQKSIIKKSLHGREIKISGFIIPIDSKSYVLSKNVFSHCFFCSTAGIETIMGIEFKEEVSRLKTDTFVTLEGTFFYNDEDKDDWLFSIHNAVITAQK